MNSSVLIVEDDQDLGPLLKQYLELQGFYVELRVNGKEAWIALQDMAFDIILTDVMMPVEDGFTFAARVVRGYPEMPFLFITARKLKEDVIKGLKLGADDYIIKPFDADELVLRVKNIIKRSSLKTAEPEFYDIGLYRFYPKELLLIGPTDRKILTERESQLLLLLRKNIG